MYIIYVQQSTTYSNRPRQCRLMTLQEGALRWESQIMRALAFVSHEFLVEHGFHNATLKITE